MREDELMKKWIKDSLIEQKSPSNTAYKVHLKLEEQRRAQRQPLLKRYVLIISYSFIGIAVLLLILFKDKLQVEVSPNREALFNGIIYAFSMIIIVGIFTLGDGIFRLRKKIN